MIEPSRKSVERLFFWCRLGADRMELEEIMETEDFFSATNGLKGHCGMAHTSRERDFKGKCLGKRDPQVFIE